MDLPYEWVSYRMLWFTVRVHISERILSFYRITNYQQITNKILYSLPLHKFKRYLNDIIQRSTLYRKSSNIYLYILYNRCRFVFPSFVTRGFFPRTILAKLLLSILQLYILILPLPFSTPVHDDKLKESFTPVRCDEHFMDTILGCFCCSQGELNPSVRHPFACRVIFWQTLQ